MNTFVSLSNIDRFQHKPLKSISGQLVKLVKRQAVFQEVLVGTGNLWRLVGGRWGAGGAEGCG